jgi:hypothetical protein
VPSQNGGKQLLASSFPYVWNNSAATGRIFMVLDILLFFKNCWEKLTFRLNMARLKGILREDQYTF